MAERLPPLLDPEDPLVARCVSILERAVRESARHWLAARGTPPTAVVLWQLWGLTANVILDGRHVWNVEAQRWSTRRWGGPRTATEAVRE